MQLVVFPLGGDEYALPVERVREIVPNRPARSIPAAEPWYLGVIVLREQILPVWELATRLGLPSERTTTGVVVVVTGVEPVGLVVDDVVGIRETPDRAIEPLPRSPEAVGIASIAERLVVVLDADRLLGAAADDLEALPSRELRRRARDAAIAGRSTMSRDELIAALRGL